MARTLAALVVALGLVAPGAALPSSSRHDPRPADQRRSKQPALRVTPSRVTPGAVAHVGGSGCIRGQTVTVLSAAFPGARPGRLGFVRTRARRNGGFGVDARIPPRTPRGRYAVAVRCGGTELGVLAWFRVV